MTSSHSMILIVNRVQASRPTDLRSYLIVHLVVLVRLRKADARGLTRRIELRKGLPLIDIRSNWSFLKQSHGFRREVLQDFDRGLAIKVLKP